MSRILFVLLFGWSTMAQANWSWNLGHNNPPGATVGLNFMYLWTNWAFEIGVGGVSQSSSTDSNGDETKSTSVLGDMNFRYLFRSGQVFRPYLQVGAGSAATVTTGDNTDAGAGVGGLYGGAGIYLMGNPFYVYAGLVSGGRGSGSSMQYGVGFSF